MNLIENNVFDKFIIYKKAQCFKSFRSGLFIAATSLILFISLLCDNVINSIVVDIIQSLLIIIFVFATVITISKVPTCIKVIKNKYKVRCGKLLAIKLRYRYENRSSKDKVLKFSNIRITVNEIDAEKFSVGDFVVAVFVDGIKYPILIDKEENYKILLEKKNEK